jgi:hypothetical protein
MGGGRRHPPSRRSLRASPTVTCDQQRQAAEERRVVQDRQETRDLRCGQEPHPQQSFAELQPVRPVELHPDGAAPVEDPMAFQGHLACSLIRVRFPHRAELVPMGSWNDQ